MDTATDKNTATNKNTATKDPSVIAAATSALDRFQPVAPTVLRVVIGALFIWHGIDKFNVGIPMIEEMFTMWGVPAPGLTAPASAVIEIAAGFALVVGFATRLAALVLSVLIGAAIFFVKRDLGIISSDPMPGAELDLALLAGLVALILLGPGRFSLDEKLGVESLATSTPQRSMASA